MLIRFTASSLRSASSRPYHAPDCIASVSFCFTRLTAMISGWIIAMLRLSLN